MIAGPGLAFGAMAGLLAVSAPAYAQQSASPQMVLGAVTAAPPGYLSFCARTPDQCGLAGARDAEGRPIASGALRQELFKRYYWATAFGDAPPAAGARPHPAPSAAVGYDWAAAFSKASHASPLTSATRLPAPPSPEPLAAASPMTSEAPPSASPPLPMDRALMAKLNRANLSVNRAIRYVSDETLFGDEGYWHLSLDPGGVRAGDCKDFVLEKRRALIADGVSASALAIAIVQTSSREAHAILLVNTDQGELVLDSLSSWIEPWWKTNYRWIERQAPGRQLTWVSIG